MKKDHVRDYTAAAFRFWAYHGCPTYEDAVGQIRRRALRKACDHDSINALAYAEAEVEKAYAGLCDISACSQTFKTLTETGHELICEAVRAVYMVEPWRTPKRGEISCRVVAFAYEAPLSERQVYTYLRHARDLFALARGLRVDDGHEWCKQKVERY